MNDSYLFNALRGNAIFSLVSGILGILLSGWLANYIGASLAWPFALVGAVLLGHALILWLGSGRRPVAKLLAQYAILGDIGWILGTIILILIDPWDFTTRGKMLLGVLADIVALFGLLQYVGLRKMRQSKS